VPEWIVPRFRRIRFVAVASCWSAIACRTASPRSPSAQTPTPAVAPDPSIQADNDRFVQQILTRIGDRQNEPADKVFENVVWLTGSPVRQFLAIMNVGYARALGVRCTYCHVETNFASEDKRPKRAAREMAAMHRQINQELRKMQNLQTMPPESRAINCSTCHRGSIDPLGRR